jgi:hypothetical protein
MRAAGLTGVLAAALALPLVGWALAQPDADPLAIFDREQNPADVAVLAELIGPESIAAITSGPQLVRLDDTIVAIAFRASTVPDGRSTDWDAYCLVTARDPGASRDETGREDSDGAEPDSAEPDSADLDGAGAWQLGGNCVSPERFETQGIEAARRATPGPEGLTFDWVVWGPEGAPRITQNRSAVAQEWSGSVTDALAYAGLQPAGVASLPDIDGAQRLVMGPAQIASSSATDGGTVTVGAYLIDSAVEGTRGLAPQYCLFATVDGTEASTACAALPIVEREGLSVRSSAPGQNWLVAVGPDGSIRFDGF